MRSAVLVPVTAVVTASVVGGATAALSRTLQRIGTRERAAKAGVFHELATAAPRGQVVFAGDSITELYRTAESYAPLTTATGLAVHNRGISGETSLELLARWDDVVALRPLQLVILIGTNDLGGGRSPEEIAGTIGELMRRVCIDSPETQVHLLAVYPVNPLVSPGLASRVIIGKRTPEDLVELNQRLQRVAAAHGVHWVDLTAALADAHGRLDAAATYDGLHLNAEGYRRVTATLLPRLLEACGVAQPAAR